MTETRNSSPQSAAPPPKSGGRIAVIDMLRGFALAAILLIHVAAFARPGAPPGFNYSGNLLNEAVLAGLILLIEGKFFSLFALLFGISFAIQYRRAPPMISHLCRCSAVACSSWV
ncbi:MAG: hypothetical protein HC822_12880 [Oscillochloris sp.]|nr:hypothetical protein [Oscillochloris sp.]